jgi:MFS family permease
LRVFVPFAVGYALAFLLRSVNAVIGGDIAASLDLTASDLGLITSAYLIAYGVAQLPLGLLLDRFGPRRVEANLLLVAALGALMCAFAQSAGIFAVGRFLVGLGVSCTLVAAFQANVLWWPVARVPLLNGLIMAVGGVGALVATAPSQAVLHFVDWRELLVFLSVATILIAGVFFVVVPEHTRRRTAGATWSAQLRGFGTVFGDRLFWRLAPLTLSTQATYIAYQSLWAGPWLRDVARLDPDTTAMHLLALAISLIIGFALAGFAADRLRRLGIGPTVVVGAAATIFVGAQILLLAEAVMHSWIWWMVFGVFGVTPIICYAWLTEHFAKDLAGRVVTALNVLVFAAAFLLQYAIGAVIELWPATGDGSFARQGYQAAFVLVLSLEIPALVWFLRPATEMSRGAPP